MTNFTQMLAAIEEARKEITWLCDKMDAQDKARETAKWQS